MTDDTPQHIRPPWQQVATRMQQQGRQTQGYAILKIEILIRPDGNPVLWFESDSHQIKLRPPWQRVAARMQHQARKVHGNYAMLDIQILINADGNPVLWFEPDLHRIKPTLRRIEPKRSNVCYNELVTFLIGVDEEL